MSASGDPDPLEHVPTSDTDKSRLCMQSLSQQPCHPNPIATLLSMIYACACHIVYHCVCCANNLHGRRDYAAVVSLRVPCTSLYAVVCIYASAMCAPSVRPCAFVFVLVSVWKWHEPAVGCVGVYVDSNCFYPTVGRVVVLSAAFFSSPVCISDERKMAQLW